MLCPRAFLRPFILLGVIGCGPTLWAVDFKDFFPTDFPAIEAKSPVANSQEDDGEFRDDWKKLTHELKNSVTYFARRRTSTCWGSPCKIQAFPMAYTSSLSGFWGGVRGNIIDLSESNPYRLKVDGMVVRADSSEWLSFIKLDVPHFPLLFASPRLKMRTDYAFSTEFQYYGTGNDWKKNLKEERARYSLRQKDIYLSLIFPLNSPEDENQFGFATSYILENFGTDRFRNLATTNLYVDRPTNYQGDTLNSFSAGILIDSRDSEILARRGQWLEFLFETGWTVNGDNRYYRTTLVDRRYFSHRRWTLAHRLSADAFFGDPPFWKLRSVGGTSPILDLNGSGIFVGLSKGRYHEPVKFIESLEPRYRLPSFRFFGQLGEGSLIPLGVDVGQFGPHFAWSTFTGISMWWNRSLLLQLFVAKSMERYSANMLFEHEF
jgi:hypothetical protein